MARQINWLFHEVVTDNCTVWSPCPATVLASPTRVPSRTVGASTCACPTSTAEPVLVRRMHSTRIPLALRVNNREQIKVLLVFTLKIHKFCMFHLSTNFTDLGVRFGISSERLSLYNQTVHIGLQCSQIVDVQQAKNIGCTIQNSTVVGVFREWLIQN